MRPRFYLFILIAALPATCLLRADDLPPAKLFPFAIGTEWTYQFTSRDKDGKVLDRKVETSKVIGVHMFGDERWYNINEFDSAIWARMTSKGEEEADVSLDEETLLLKKDASFLYFKYPAKKGDQWKIRDKTDDDFEQSMRVKEVGTILKTPADKFTCIVYELIEEGKAVMRFHVAVGVGIVKFETLDTYTEDGGTETHELTKYVIGMK